ncbi:hypothetical protein IFM89_037780 [Coptis chinensis]|uniref:GST N-terminal domain-containing protein n=1 Tax=Coptis chinensis TaxID=261450 RepID=A0A835LKS3_9MAGN|nr:hypothetical protein IFM89_037780 [Coptis chinensis]
MNRPHFFLKLPLIKKTITQSSAMTTGIVPEILPPVLTSASDPPPLFDGTTRLYISYICPYAQRPWITRNCKGLQEKIKLVAIDLNDRPAWYKEKLYPANKVPALEHNNEVKGESLDLIKYLDSEFEGPSLFPDDPLKREFAEELFSSTDAFSRDVIAAVKGNRDVGIPFDHLENALSKFDDGPFFLGQFSLVDIAYAPFVQRYYPLVLDVKEYDATTGRPKLTSWIEEMDKIEGYKQTKQDPQMLLGVLKKVFAVYSYLMLDFELRNWAVKHLKPPAVFTRFYPRVHGK